MGDRGNVAFEDSEGHKLYFYSHWGGSELVDDCRTILLSTPGLMNRLNGDFSYGVRGMIHGLLLATHPDGVEETGSGISFYPEDGPVVITFFDDGTVDDGDGRRALEEFLYRTR